MLAVAGGKGGGGKTTVTLCLARRLAERGHAPVVVDADVDMPNLHVLAEVDRRPTASALVSDVHIEEVLHRSPRLPGVNVVTAGEPPSTGQALDRLDAWHGPVLVDCPAGAGEDAIGPLRECDRTVLVTTTAREALADTHKTGAVARRLGADPLFALVRATLDSRDYSTDPSESFECRVARLPFVDEGRVDSHPRVAAACEAVIDAWLGGRADRYG